MSNRSTVEFLDAAAHDLRTWVTIIYGGAHLLKSRLETMDAESRRLLLDDIESASDKLRQAVEGMLLLARLEAGRGPAAGPVLLQEALPKMAAALSQLRPGRPVRAEAERVEPVLAVPAYLEYTFRALFIDLDQVLAEGMAVDLRGARSPDGEAVVSLRAPAQTGPRTELLVAEYGGPEGGTERKRVAPLVARRLATAQSGRLTARLSDDSVIEVCLILPFAAGV